MSFSDKELARLKESLENPSEHATGITTEQGLALIARLEAAERYATLIREHHNHGWFEPEYEAWRKSKGE